MAGELGRVVRRARQENRGALSTFWYEDDGMQLHAVAHGDHLVALDVVETVGRRRELGRRLAGIVRILDRQRGLGRQRFDEQESAEHRREQGERLNAVENFHRFFVRARRVPQLKGS